MRTLACLALSAALIALHWESAGAQGDITADPAMVRRILADTTLVHDLPARQSATRVNVALDVTRTEHAAMGAQLDRLSALLRSDSAVRRSRGVSLVFRNEIDVDTSHHGRLLTGVVSMTSWPYGVLDGRLQYYAASSVSLQVNPDLCPADEKVYGVGFRRAPKSDGRFQGFPMRDSVVVITHRTAPPCLPVSRAQVLVALRKQLDPVLRLVEAGSEAHERAHALDALLTQMSPAERRSDAYLSAKGCEVVVCFTTAGEDEAEQLVIPNPDFYDRSRPTTIQAVSLALGPLLAPSNPRNEFHERFIRDVLAAFDWPALTALVQ